MHRLLPHRRVHREPGPRPRRLPVASVHPQAVAAGFQSVYALPMRLRGTVVGALNLFRVQRGAMPDADVIAAQAFADIATIAILQHRAASRAQVLNDQLRQALDDRIVIEQAKGMLAERSAVDVEGAFTRLRTYASEHDLRLVDVAADLISGAMPADALDPR